MLAQHSIGDFGAEQLRSELYNSTVVSIKRCHDELLIVRVRPDTGNTAERLLPQIPCSILAVKPPGFVSTVSI